MNIIDYNGYQTEFEVLVTFEYDSSKYIIYRLLKDNNSDDQTDKIFTAEISETDSSYSFDNVFLDDVWNKLLRVIMKGLVSGVRIFDINEELDDKTYSESSLRESRVLKVSTKFVDELRKLSSEDEETQTEEEEASIPTRAENHKYQSNTDNTTIEKETEKEVEKENVVQSMSKVNFVPEYDETRIEFSGIEKEIGTVSEILRNIIKKNAQISDVNTSLDDKKKELADYEADLKKEEEKLQKLKFSLTDREADLIKKEQSLISRENAIMIKQQQIDEDTIRLNKNLEILNELAKEVNESLS